MNSFPGRAARQPYARCPLARAEKRSSAQEAVLLFRWTRSFLRTRQRPDALGRSIARAPPRRQARLLRILWSIGTRGLRSPSIVRAKMSAWPHPSQRSPRGRRSSEPSRSVGPRPGRMRRHAWSSSAGGTAPAGRLHRHCPSVRTGRPSCAAVRTEAYLRSDRAATSLREDAAAVNDVIRAAADLQAFCDARRSRRVSSAA